MSDRSGWLAFALHGISGIARLKAAGDWAIAMPRIASIAKDHEHDIHNARRSNPFYTGSNFNSLLILLCRKLINAMRRTERTSS
ncbi:MAG: hypothetical protein CBARDMAM_7049 [uncultured Caballeronia sp.]|nr:MAG: hypothetical protein CBARDMAM_7049 [uncultured Caballeronia sp.]